MSKYPFRGRQLTCRACEPLLIEYAEPHLDSGRRERVAMHLSACASCRTKLAGIGDLATALQSARTNENRFAPDLWPAIEATIRGTAQDKAVLSLARPSLSGLRNALLGDSGWGQALPIGATVFAAGILVFVFVDGARHSAKNSTNATVAAVQPPDAEKSVGGKARFNQTTIAASSVASVKLAAGAVRGTREAPENDARVQIALRADDLAGVHGVARQEDRSVGQRRVSSHAEIADTDFANRVAERDNRYYEVRAAAARGRYALSARESGNSRLSQIAAVAEDTAQDTKINAEHDVVLPAHVRFGTFGITVENHSGRSSSVVASVSPTHGSYAAEDDTDSKVSFADASGSISRQQKLFSY